MLKYVLVASVLLTGSALAEDTKPVLSKIADCNMTHHQNSAVKMEFTVTKEGTVEDIHVVGSSGNTGLDDEAVKCVAKFIYKPATHDGVAIAQTTRFILHQNRIQDLDGDRRAFAELERDADRRCQKLYPIDRRFQASSQPISLVVVTRTQDGELKLVVTQSAGETADRHAIDCLKKLIAEHEELPPAFSRGIAVNWEHRR